MHDTLEPAVMQLSVRDAYTWTARDRAPSIAVIDVLRATSVIAAALAAGAARVIPVARVEDAFALRERLGSSVMLGGERGNRRIDGFDAGNSPAEYARERVEGRTVVITTTNGTRAIDLAKASCTRLYAAALTNAAAVAAQLLRDGEDAVALCAGTEGRFSLEDFVCAGALADACAAGDALLDDAAIAAAEVFRANRADLPGFLAEGSHARTLAEAGFAADVREAAVLDRYAVVPFLDGDSLKTRL